MHKEPLTLKQFAEKYSNFPVRKLRWIDFLSRDDEHHDPDPKYAKFGPAFVRVGRSVYIDEDRFFTIVRGETVPTVESVE